MDMYCSKSTEKSKLSGPAFHILILLPRFLLLEFFHDILIPNPLRESHRPLAYPPHPACALHTFAVTPRSPITMCDDHQLIGIATVRLEHFSLVWTLAKVAAYEVRHRDGGSCRLRGESYGLRGQRVVSADRAETVSLQNKTVSREAMTSSYT